MDFRAYVEHKRKEAHMEIISDICMAINNCNDETRKTECYPLHCMDNLYKITANSFCMLPRDNSKTNRELIEIVEDHGYKVGFVIDDGEMVMKFERRF